MCDESSPSFGFALKVRTKQKLLTGLVEAFPIFVGKFVISEEEYFVKKQGFIS